MPPSLALVAALGLLAYAPRQPPPLRTSAARRAAVVASTGISHATSLLAEYDAGHRAAAASEGAEGFGGALTANAWAGRQEQPPLAGAVRVLADAATQRDEPEPQQPNATVARLALGICAEDAFEGIGTLKAWVAALGLPKGPLHGMDDGGVPRDMSTFGPVYIKYLSRPNNGRDPPGTAMLSGYTGDFRGVYFSPSLTDGVFRQFAVLPLDLFQLDAAPIELRAAAAPPDGDAPSAAAPSARAVSDASAGSNTRSGQSVGQQRVAAAALAAPLQDDDVRALLAELPLLAELAPLGVRAALVRADADEGWVHLACTAPPRLRAAVEMQLRTALREADPRVRRVAFDAEAGGAEQAPSPAGTQE